MPTEEALRTVFDREDRNKDGYLDRSECYRALKSMGHSLHANSLPRVMELMDKNRDGKISFEGRVYCLHRLHNLKDA